MHRSSFKKEIRNAIVIYLLTWLCVFILVTVVLSRGKRTFFEATGLFFEFLGNSSFVMAIHLLFVIVFSLFLVVRYFIRLYKKKGGHIFFKQLAYRLLIPILGVFIVFKSIIYVNANENYDFNWDENLMNLALTPNDFYELDRMHRGMSVFGWDTKTNDAAIDSLIKANIEWVAVIPFIDQEDETSITVRRPVAKDAVWKSRDSIFIQSIKQLKAKGLHVNLKPHLWTFSGWRANLTLNSDEAWNTWFDSYEAYILYYARMAEFTGAELFCIGTELKTSIKKQPERWKALIKKVRAIYSGQLTYAANWHDEYEYIDFWDQLDFIGIQAYFPLTKNKNPDLATIENGWTKHIKKLEGLYQMYHKPILFTEIGYKSDASATIKPWEWGSYLSVLSEKKSDRTQQLAYEAFFNQLWHKKWFAGAYFWQWHTYSKKGDVDLNLDFSPRFKPAENTMAKWYGKRAGKEDL